MREVSSTTNSNVLLFGYWPLSRASAIKIDNLDKRLTLNSIMNNFIYQTRFPVLSYKGDEILPAGAILDEKTLKGLKSHSMDRRLYPIGFSDMVRTDLEGFLDNPPYSEIFRDTESRDHIFAMLKKIHIPRCTVEVAEYFREKDFYTYRHMLVVFAISTHLVSLLSPTWDYSRTIIASTAHDIGKCSIPVNLLKKETPLTRSEHEQIEHHTFAGFALIHYYTNNSDTDLASRVARDHHERRDGSGYPAGLTTIDRMIEIVIASDMYDALVSSRPYRCEPYDNRSALEELSASALHGKISSETVQALVASNRKKHTDWRECVISNEKRGFAPKGNNYGILADDEEGNQAET